MSTPDEQDETYLTPQESAAWLQYRRDRVVAGLPIVTALWILCSGMTLWWFLWGRTTGDGPAWLTWVWVGILILLVWCGRRMIQAWRSEEAQARWFGRR